MSDVNTYINDLISLQNNLEPIINKILQKNSGKIIGALKLRLFNFGVDGDGNKILPDYQPSTIEIKKGKGQRTSHVTLRNTGEFYDSLFIRFTDNELIVDSLSEKKIVLIEKYGLAILELTIQEQELIIFGVIEPEILKHIDSKTGYDIDLSF